MMALQSSRESYLVLPAPTLIELRLEQDWYLQNRFISTIYVLNGRKVMTCILKKLKKKKI